MPKDLDGTTEQQGTSSAENQEGTSSENLETFTKEQHEEGVRKARSDALADIGRLQKSSENAIKAAQAAEVRIARMLERQDEEDRERHKEEPDKLSAIDERIRRREVEAKLVEAEQKLSEQEEVVKEAKRKEVESTQERNAREIAARLTVDPKLLTRLAKLTDGSVEAIEAEARNLPKKSESAPMYVDSGKTSGGIGGKKPTLEELKSATPSEFQEKVKAGIWVL